MRWKRTKEGRTEGDLWKGMQNKYAQLEKEPLGMSREKKGRKGALKIGPKSRDYTIGIRSYL